MHQRTIDRKREREPGKGTVANGRHEPAASVIAKFGGVRPLARLLQLDPGAVSKWQAGKHALGLIPARYHATLLALARSKSIELRADDLIPS